MLDRIEPPVNGRPCAAVLMLPLHKLVDLAKRYLGKGNSDGPKEQAQIEGIARNGMPGELPTLQICLKPINGGLADVIHRLSLL
jgi:hypothetical protein